MTVHTGAPASAAQSEGVMEILAALACAIALTLGVAIVAIAADPNRGVQ